MASQSVLIPSSSSLFITDKSWLRPGKASKPGQSTFRLGQSSEVDGLSVTVVKTCIKSGRKGNREVPRAATSLAYRNLQFVNSTQSKRGKRDEEDLRRLIRSHVMTGTKRRTIAKPTKPRKFEEENQRFEEALYGRPEEESDEEILSQHSMESWSSSTSSEMTLVPSGISTPLYGITPFTIHPHFHRFISYYTVETASSMYPLQAFLGFNPVQAFWFPMALTDEILLYTIMYSAAFGLSQADPKTNPNDINQLAGPIFQLLTSRLADRSSINDTTIGAVSCLAMVENMSGNRAKWKVHVNGLREMIKTRGGIENIHASLVMKIIRADSEGSVDNLTRPCLPPLQRMAPSLHLTLPVAARDGRSKVFDLLGCEDLRPQMKVVLLEIADFTKAIRYYTSQDVHLVGAIDPRSFDEDLLSIARTLLEMDSLSAVEEVVQIAALIFIKSVGRGLPFRPTGSQLLPKRLKQALSMVLNFAPAAFSDEMLMWLLSMGGFASCKGSEHAWFVDELVRLGCGGNREVLKEVLFVDVVHEKACATLFEEVEILRVLRERGDD